MILLDPIEIFRMATDTIQGHKLRSMLTTLGVFIGVGAVLTNVAMMGGFDMFFREQLSGMGANFVQVQAGNPFQREMPGGEEAHFEEHVYESLSRLPNLRASTASREAYGTLRYRGGEEGVLVRGVKPGYFDAIETEVVEGAEFGPQDKFTIIVGNDLKEYIFDRPMAVGSTVDMTLMTADVQATEEFKVKGVHGGGGSMFSSAGGMMSVVYIPVSTINDLVGAEGYTSIGLYAESSDTVDKVQREASDTLDRVLRLPPIRTVEQNEKKTTSDEGGGYLSEQAQEQRMSEFQSMMGERDEYSIISSQEILGFAEEVSSAIELLFIGIASISLLVGGIGIANIMLVTVSERTREIGVMKAVGAKNWDVLMVFLLEAGLIGLIGGSVGLGFAYGAANTIIPYLLGFPGVIPIEWVGIALGLSFAIGVLSGLYPAWRAAQMDPVEALSYE